MQTTDAPDPHTDATEPTPQDFGMPPPQPKGPKVVGIMSIVWASIGLILTALGVVWGFIGPGFMESAADGAPLPPNIEYMGSPIYWAQMGGGVIGTVLLMSAGIATVTRKPSGRTLHLAYAMFGLVTSAAGVFIAMGMIKQMTPWVEQNPDSVFVRGYSETSQFISTAVMTAIGAAWPLFCIVWFGMLGKRPEAGATEQVA